MARSCTEIARKHARDNTWRDEFMIAGRGVVIWSAPSHARRGEMSGFRVGLRFRKRARRSNLAFQHFEAVDLPVVEAPGVWARGVFAGSVFGQTSPVGMSSDWFYAEVMLEPGTSAPLDPHYEERAIYICIGEIEIAGENFEAPRLLVFRPGDLLRSERSSRAARGL